MNEDLQTDVEQLQTLVREAVLPDELRSKVEQMIARMQKSAGQGVFFEEFEKMSHYINWLVELPWNNRSEDTLDLEHAKQVLDAHHHGLEDIKDRLLEYLAVLKLNRDKGESDIAKAPILLLVGLVGTGKTTFAYSLAEAMGREVVRIPFGGMGSARDLRGQSRLHLEAEPGYIIKALKRAKTKNPVMLLDEIDRVSEQARADIMGVLVEALDPEQNSLFIDHYIDYPFDLSEVLFIGTANATSHIATAVMDRMEPISMPSYTDEEKIQIAKKYLLPKISAESGLPESSISFDEEVWPQVVRPLGYDAGIRTLQRTIKGIVRKVAREYVEGKVTQVNLSHENIKDYLPTYKTELI